MIKKLKLMSIVLLTFLFVSCEDLLGTPKDDVNSDYSTGLVDAFMSEITGNRGLSDGDIEGMKVAILAEIASEGLNNSTTLSALMPVIASSAQVSLSSVTSDADKIAYIKIISKSSITVVGNKVGSESTSIEITSIVSSISVAMVESISETGIAADLIEETTAATVSAIISNLGNVEIESADMIAAITLISSESSVAVSKNSGATEDIIMSTLSNLPAVTTVAAVSIEGMSLNANDVFTGSYGAVATSITTIKESGEIETDLSIILVQLLEESSASLSENKDLTVNISDVSDKLLEGTVAAVKDNAEALTNLKTEAEKSTNLDIDVEDLDAAVEDANANDPDNTMTAAEYEALAFTKLKNTKLDAALDYYQKAIDTTHATAQAKLWWSALTIASISVDSNVADVAKNLGIQGYPSTMAGLLAGDMMTSMEGNYTDSDGFDNGYYGTVFAGVENQEKYADLFDDEDLSSNTINSQMMAMLFNFKTNYPNGLNNMMDSFVDSTAKVDEVIEMLLTISDTDSFTYSYTMFNDKEYDFYIDGGQWPTEELVAGEETVPMDITVGKAEVYVLVSTLEMLKSVVLMGQSVSLSLDVDGYWDIFNPIDGNFWTYDETGKLEKPNEDFDYSTIKNPLSDGFLYAREDATTILAESKIHFSNTFKYIKTASELVIERDETSDFFLSPGNEMITADTWAEVEKAQGLLVTVADKLIDSIDNNTAIVIPDFESIGSLDDAIAVSKDWPTEGATVNLGALFSKPLLTLDNLFEITTAGEFVFYTVDGDTYTKATTFEEAKSYFIKFNDITLNGLVSGFNKEIAETIGMEIQEDGSIYFELPVETNVLVGYSLTAKDAEFTIGEKTYTSSGSFFHGLFADDLALITSEIVEFDDEYDDEFDNGDNGEYVDNGDDGEYVDEMQPPTAEPILFPTIGSTEVSDLVNTQWKGSVQTAYNENGDSFVSYDISEIGMIVTFTDTNVLSYYYDEELDQYTYTVEDFSSNNGEVVVGDSESTTTLSFIVSDGDLFLTYEDEEYNSEDDSYIVTSYVLKLVADESLDLSGAVEESNDEEDNR